MYIPNNHQIYSKKTYPHFLPDNIVLVQKKPHRRNDRGRYIRTVKTDVKKGRGCV
jgi:hypothetical protein